MSSTRDFLLAAGCLEPRGRRGRQPWKPRNLLPIYVDVAEGVGERVVYKMETISNTMTPEEAAKAARKMLSGYTGGRHDTTRSISDVTTTIMLHRELMHHVPGPQVVPLVVRTLLPPAQKLMYHDRLWWDINAPRASVEAYCSQVCSDLGLGVGCLLSITRAMKDAVDKAKAAVASGQMQAGGGPEAGLVAEAGARYPDVVEVAPELLEAIKAKHAAAKAAAAAEAEAQAAEAAAALQLFTGGSDMAAAAAASSQQQTAATTAPPSRQPSVSIAAGQSTQGGPLASAATADDSAMPDAEEVAPGWSEDEGSDMPDLMGL